MEGDKILDVQPRRTLRRRGRGTVRHIVGTGETRLRPSSEIPGVPSQEWTGSVEPYKRSPREVGESGAGVGAAHMTEEAVMPVEERGRTWSAGSMEVSAGECPTG